MLAILTSGCAGIGAPTAETKVAATADPVCKAAVSAVCLTDAEIAALKDDSARTIAKNNEGLRAACPRVVKPCVRQPATGNRQPEPKTSMLGRWEAASGKRQAPSAGGARAEGERAKPAPAGGRPGREATS